MGDHIGDRYGFFERIAPLGEGHELSGQVLGVHRRFIGQRKVSAALINFPMFYIQRLMLRND